MTYYLDAQKLSSERPGDFEIPTSLDLQNLSSNDLVLVCCEGNYVWCEVLSVDKDKVYADSSTAIDYEIDVDLESIEEQYQDHVFEKRHIFQVVPSSELSWKGLGVECFGEILGEVFKLIPVVRDASYPIYDSIEQVGKQKYKVHKQHKDAANQLMDLLGKNEPVFCFDWSRWWKAEGKGYVEYEVFLQRAELGTLLKLLVTHYKMEQHYPGHLAEMVRDGHLWLLLCRMNILVNYSVPENQIERIR